MQQIRAAILRDFGVDLPISGGTGNSMDNPIVIEKGRPDFRDPVSVEYEYLKCIFTGRGVKFKLLLQELHSHNGKNIDKLKCETEEVTPTEIITQVENYYFDISQF